MAGFPRPDSTASVPAAPTRLLRTTGCACPRAAPEAGEQFSCGISLSELPLWTALPGFGVTVFPSLGKSQQFASPGTHEVQQIADCLLGLLNQKGICPIGPSLLIDQRCHWRKPTWWGVGSDHWKLTWHVLNVFCVSPSSPGHSGANSV